MIKGGRGFVLLVQVSPGMLMNNVHLVINVLKEWVTTNDTHCSAKLTTLALKIYVNFPCADYSWICFTDSFPYAQELVVCH